MITIIFKNMQKSVYVTELAEEKLNNVINRFPLLANSNIRLTLSMDNSPFQAGPDSFSAKVVIKGSKYDGVVLEKSSENLSSALADLTEHTLERLNRYGDKKRVKKIRKNRKTLKDFASI